MAALLHPDTFSLFSLDPAFDPAFDPSFGPSNGSVSARRRPSGDAPWNDPSFLATPVPLLRPQFELIRGGLDGAARPIAEPAAATARRALRTLGAGLALAVLVSFAALGALTLLGADAAASVPASPAAINHPTGVDATTTSSTPVEVVVRSGETLWSIARRLKPTGEIRGLVDALAERAGGASVDAGQRIDISGLLAD